MELRSKPLVMPARLVKCKSCGDRSSTSRSEYCFCVTCPEETSYADVKDLLDAYTQEEQINEWKCEKCSKVGCVRQAVIKLPPNVLMVHISRLQRCSPRVTFGRELVVNCERRKCRYALYAVIVYRSMGSNGGHYFAYVRSGRGQDEQWYLADDDETQSQTKSLLQDYINYTSIQTKAGSHQDRSKWR